MQSKIFFFSQSQQNRWLQIRSEFNAFLNDIMRNSSYGSFKDDFEIEIRKHCKKRSGKQLRSYWRLIRVIKNWMNSKGNRFTDEQVSNWAKIQAGHCDVFPDGTKEARSIANNSDVTVEDMREIIEFILEFGVDENIPDCYIKDYELDELLKFYER